jgi:hypothetical protein
MGVEIGIGARWYTADKLREASSQIKPSRAKKRLVFQLGLLELLWR